MIHTGLFHDSNWFIPWFTLVVYHFTLVYFITHSGLFIGVYSVLQIWWMPENTTIDILHHDVPVEWTTNLPNNHAGCLLRCCDIIADFVGLIMLWLISYGKPICGWLLCSQFIVSVMEVILFYVSLSIFVITHRTCSHVCPKCVSSRLSLHPPIWTWIGLSVSVVF